MPRRGQKVQQTPSTPSHSANRGTKASQKQQEDDLDWGYDKNHDKSQSWQKQQNVPDQPNNNKGNTSIWLLNQLDKKQQQAPQISRRGKAILNTSIIDAKPDLQKQQLQPDVVNTSWMNTQSNSNGRKDQQEDKPEQIKKRGNRQEKEKSGGFSKKPSHYQDRQPRNNYEHNNNYNNPNNQNYGQRKQNRGRGRGNYRGGYRNNNDYRSQATNETGARYRQKQQKNEYYNQNKRDNNAYNNSNSNSNYNNKGSHYNNSQKQLGEGQDRAKRGNRYQQKNNNYQQRSHHYQNKNQYQQRGNNYTNNNNNYNNNNYASKQEVKEQPKEKERQKQKEKSKDKVIVPKGRKCWPQSSIFILGCKFSITFRPLNEFRCKLLIIPYTTVKMEYYPGNIINSSEVDYKKKIFSKGQAISAAGNVYMQKAIQVGNFTALAFLKVEEGRKSDSLKIGIRQILKLIQRKVEDTISLQSLIFPVSEQLGHIDVVIKTFLDNLQDYRKIKQVYIISNSQRCFIDGMNAFSKEIQNLLNNNEILIS